MDSNKKFVCHDVVPMILASASPRRKMLLESYIKHFEICVPDIEETPKKGELPEHYCARNAREKAQRVAQIKKCQKFILSADTIVVDPLGCISEKPNDATHAFQMLKNLSGHTHIVYTGYCLYQDSTEIVCNVVSTQVTFRSLSDNEIYQYIETKEPFDKAGAYGIQGPAMGFVSRIVGSYTNVMGLPLSHVIEDLKRFTNL